MRSKIGYGKRRGSLDGSESDGGSAVLHRTRIDSRGRRFDDSTMRSLPTSLSLKSKHDDHADLAVLGITTETAQVLGWFYERL